MVPYTNPIIWSHGISRGRNNTGYLRRYHRKDAAFIQLSCAGTLPIKEILGTVLLSSHEACKFHCQPRDFIDPWFTSSPEAGAEGFGFLHPHNMRMPVNTPIHFFFTSAEAR